MGTALEEASGCSSESGIMVLEQKPARKQGAPNRCCHRTNPTVSASSLTTIAWWPMPAYSKLDKLDQLVLNRNQLSGSIPVELGDMDSLSQLWLRDNGLSGQIP